MSAKKSRRKQSDAQARRQAIANRQPLASRRAHVSQRGITTPGEESRAAVAAIVFWMLATLLSASAQVVSLIAAIIRELHSIAAAETVFAVGIMVAAITGGAALCSAVVALRTSSIPPPKLVLWPAIVIATAPVLYLLLRL